ncbi:MAG: hypothetical protein JXB60_03520 [Candidatus Cloacimonetes bacterium]|nr:hypothetical protein [Candidatus Cloacimonadota bacterium]
MSSPYVYDFRNSDDFLKTETSRIKKERQINGLIELVGKLQAIIINVEKDRVLATTVEFLRTTGYHYQVAFENKDYLTCVLKLKGSPDILIRCRNQEENPFRSFNLHPKALNLPNTRLETYIFQTPDIREYFRYHSTRGVRFIGDDIINTDHYRFVQTFPSSYTGISYAVIQWKDQEEIYPAGQDEILKWNIPKPEKGYLINIRELDHTATRVRARDRDPAIIEFMELTCYNFDFAIYVELFNSITNVARLSDDAFAMVFTSGISPFIDEQHSGPTEKFIRNYGPRVHHLAFRTENIEKTYRSLKKDKQEFLIGLIGSPQQGLKQTFTETSPNSLLVKEYVHRYGEFKGFFTKNNVTLLTGSTDKQ